MAKRPTIRDVAREANVSVSTVDRALNGRMAVRDDTLRKIAEAAHRVGYHARGLFDHRLVEMVPEMRLGFFLLKEKQEFYKNFRREIERAVASRTDIRGTVDIRFSQSQSPEEFATILRGLGARSDAIAGIAVNHQMLDRVVEDLRAEGVPTFSLLNDFAQGIRRNYIGLNNMKVGRQAAWMITKTCPIPGKLAIFVGGNRWHGHDLREVGF
ncbi:MAG: LacI family DNA-binding transcriptional regulator, partial [Rhodobacteraceae bacterium]|nr:LacI family DNA-binding transcriptional regulator [Paracoccaceae bacterium]